MPKIALLLSRLIFAISFGVVWAAVCYCVCGAEAAVFAVVVVSHAC